MLDRSDDQIYFSIVLTMHKYLMLNRKLREVLKMEKSIENSTLGVNQRVAGSNQSREQGDSHNLQAGDHVMLNK